jgi:hypothetical protein
MLSIETSDSSIACIGDKKTERAQKKPAAALFHNLRDSPLAGCSFGAFALQSFVHFRFVRLRYSSMGWPFPQTYSFGSA